MSRHLVVMAMIVLIVPVMAGPASAVVQNVALFKPTGQSTNGFGFTGGPAVDGNLGNFTHTASGDLAPWWEVDLSEDFLIEGINFYNRTSCCGERLYNLTWEVRDELDAVLYTSPEFNPWDGLTPATPPDPGAGPFAIDLSGEPGGGVSGRKVRVNKAGFGGSEWLSLAEVEVLADAPLPPVNVALGAPVTATGPVWGGWDPGRITDGDLGTIVHSDAGVTTFAYEIDLGETIPLQSIDVWGRQDGCCVERLADYRLSVHEDSGGGIGAEVWSAELVGQGSVVGAPDTFLAGDGVGTFTGQWIRVDRIDDTISADYVLQIAEVQAFAIPEPSTIMLLGMGGLLLPLLWRRFRRA